MSEFSIRIAAEIRAEMARQMKTVAELGRVIGKTHNSASARYRGRLEYSLNETALIAKWLGVSVEQLAASDSLKGVER